VVQYVNSCNHPSSEEGRQVGNKVEEEIAKGIMQSCQAEQLRRRQQPMDSAGNSSCLTPSPLGGLYCNAVVETMHARYVGLKTYLEDIQIAIDI